MNGKTEKPPQSTQVIRAIAQVTLQEILRDKVLYNIVLCAFAILGIGILGSQLTFIRPERVVVDFGLSALSISSCMMAILIGATLIGREIERRTVHLALARPISRQQFVLGKYVGLVGVLALNWFFLSLAYLAILALSSTPALDAFSVTLFEALLLCLVECLMLASVTLLIASFSTSSLAVMISIGIYLVGNSISQVQALVEKMGPSVTQNLLKWAVFVLPNFEHFKLGTKVAYALPVSPSYLGLGILYSVFMIGFNLLLAGVFMQVREV